jgi:mannose-6-phosphate isomerase-like protein (cupin superfamily)
VHIPAEHVAAQLKEHFHVYIVDPRLGFNQRTFRFWINYRALGEEMEYSGKQLGHRHTVEAVIYIHQGHGYSVIDGVKYPWEAGDIICVPVFAWHRHHNESQEDLIYFAATTGPFSMATGIALYEEENYPEYWVFAQMGEEAMKTLIPGGAEAPPGGKVDLDQSRWKPQDLEATASRRPLKFISISSTSRKRKKSGGGRKSAWSKLRSKISAHADGTGAYGVDAKLGFHVKVLGTLFAEIPPEAVRRPSPHLRRDKLYNLGRGLQHHRRSEVRMEEGRHVGYPGFRLAPALQYGRETARFLVHTNRPCMESTGYIHTQQGEPADYE